MRSLSVVAFLLILVLAHAIIFAQDQMEDGGELPTIVELAQDDGRFDTLVTAVKAAGLVEMLGADGPFTVLAPTDDAFDALPDGVLEDLLANPEQLAQVLSYHVVPGRVSSEDVSGSDQTSTVQGSSIEVSMQSGAVVLNGSARVIQADIRATNGVIHVIDAVLLPPEM